MSDLTADIEDEAGKQVAGWGIEKIKQMYNAFVKERTLFVNVPEAAESINKQKETPDYIQIQQYVSDGRYRHLLIAGLGLRDLEHQGKQIELAEELSSIYRSTSPIGLRIAEFSQTGLFARMITIIQKPGMTKDTIKKEINYRLSKLDRHFRPVRLEDSDDKLYQEVKLNLIYSKADFYMMIAKNPSNCSTMKAVIQRLEQEEYFSDYTKSEETNDKGARLVIFVKKETPPNPEDYMSIGHFV